MLIFNSKLFNFFKEQKKRVLFGVSGGVDSVACSYFLRNKIDGIFHVNHNILPEDKAIRDRVISYAAYLNLPVSVFNNTDLSNTEFGIEGNCRKIRVNAYDHLEDDTVLVLAHNLSDCVESYFMNWLKGKESFDPIPPQTKFNKITVLRPFLLTTKESLENYAFSRNLIPHTYYDPLNDDLTRVRNWAREIVLPLIKDRYNGLEKVVRKKVIASYKRLDIEAVVC